MPTVSAMYAALRVALGRGTANDANLPEWAAEAINEIETENTFAWMRKTSTLTATTGLNGNRLALPSARVKGVDWARTGTPEGTNGAIVYDPNLVGVTPLDFSAVDEGLAPGGFYLDGVTHMVLDSIPAASLAVQVAYWEYTEWPASLVDTSTPAILARHYAGFKACVMMTAARNLRDSRIAEVWGATASQAKIAMWMADGQFESKHRRAMAQREPG